MRTTTTPLLLSILALAAAPACTPASTAPLQADPPVEAAEELVLGTQVRKDLLVELGRDAYAIDVDANTEDDGLVVLSGPVRTDHIAALAVTIAKRSATRVDNRLRIDPMAAPDPSGAGQAIREADLEVAVMLALLDRMGPDAAEIAVEVDDYVVTLIGEVDRPKDRAEALEIAQQQQGVQEVRNDLGVIIEED